MICHEEKIRVRYAETDKMGFMYYSHYATYFEVSRVEMFRSMGISYNEMENRGIMMPVADMSVKYIKPARYDDELSIRVRVQKMPEIKMVFDYEIYNQDSILITTGLTTLFFMDAKTGRPQRAPEYVKEIFSRYFDVKTTN